MLPGRKNKKQHVPVGILRGGDCRAYSLLPPTIILLDNIAKRMNCCIENKYAELSRPINFYDIYFSLTVNGTSFAQEWMFRGIMQDFPGEEIDEG
jgi:hypothetical protein